MCWGIFASQSWTCSISAPSGTDTNLRTNCALSKSDCICTNGVADCDLRAVVIIATGAFAQDTLTGVKGLNDQIDDITENVQDDLEQGNDADRYTFGAPNAGWTGSLAASASATSGNTKNRDVSLAGRLSYGTGVWAHSFGFAGELVKPMTQKLNKRFTVHMKPTVISTIQHSPLPRHAPALTNLVPWPKIPLSDLVHVCASSNKTT